MIYELVICAALVGGNCLWQITPQPSLAACEAVVAAILEKDREQRRVPAPVMYCRESKNGPAADLPQIGP